MASAASDDTIAVLNDLIENAKDGEYGFAKCGDRVHSPAIREVLRKRSADCGHAALELQAVVVQHGGTPSTGGTALGALHRGWVSIKDALTADTDHAILEEAARGEGLALTRHRKALKTDALPPATRDLVSRQMAGAQAHHDRIQALRDNTA